MKSVEGVSGRLPEAAKVVIAVALAYASFLLTMYINVKPVLDSVIPFRVPFKIIPVLGGFWYVLWISLAYRLAGRWYGVITAILIVSFCLIASTWFGIPSAPFSVVGFISFLLLGILTEKVNGGVGNLVCAGVNWLGYYVLFHAKMDPLGVLVLLIVAFLSGLAGDYVGRAVAKAISRIFFKG
ncbi:MAG: hypothetical protein GXO10_03990 [Crenarchaeota archaeon]|nr:hypothetical protein [Thermoproteota archaeon]